MAIFQPPDDRAYNAWLAANPSGYVINTEPNGRGYIKLHRAACGTIHTDPAIASYIKICSTSLDELDNWAVQRTGAPAPRCQIRGRNCWR